MCGTRVLKSLAASLAAVMLWFSYSGPSLAQMAGDQEARMRILQQRIDDMSKELKKMQDEQTKTTKIVTSVDKAYTTFIKGFFGTLDVSIDATTKGIEGMVAYPYTCATPQGGLPCTPGSPKAGPNGRLGWMGMMSSNGSNVGYRGSHKIGDSHVNFIYQVATGINMVAAPGLRDTWTKQSNTVTGALGLGDTYVGFQEKQWGRLRFGTMYMPYKTSTDRLNPFGGQLGNYNVVIGNTGGDNRIEFGSRADHVIIYNSPTWGGFSLDGAYQFGQNPDSYNLIAALGSADCYGGNTLGSGNLPLNCDDGGYNWGYSLDMKFEMGGLYLTAAYELHSGVNRSSDGVGSNSPYYGYLFGLGPNNALSASLLNWNDYLTFASEYPQAALAGTPGYANAADTADEWAAKVGGQYRFEFGLTISYLWEEMHRNVADNMMFQNERQRTGDWLAIEYDFNGGKDRIAVGWAHAGASVGDPAGQHNFNPNGIGQNESNMYTIAFWHKIDKQLTWYLDAADTANDGNAHYDIGAGGHGIKTDCHDATHPMFIDYSSAGPTTWGGCHEIGVSTGVNFKF
jgi:predicted porin